MFIYNLYNNKITEIWRKYIYPGRDKIPHYKVTAECADEGIELSGTWDDLISIPEEKKNEYIIIKKKDLHK
jgi:hypothetical protein